MADVDPWRAGRARVGSDKDKARTLESIVLQRLDRQDRVLDLRPGWV
jgi:hypothetical protein